MELAVLASVLALFVALGSLWLVSSLQKKLDFQNETFSKVHIKPIRSELKAVESHLRKVEQEIRQLSELKEKTDTCVQSQNEVADMVNKQMALIRSEINILDHSIPQRFRVPPKPKAKVEKVKPKPVIQ